MTKRVKSVTILLKSPTVTFSKFSPTGVICWVMLWISKVVEGNMDFIRAGKFSPSLIVCTTRGGIMEFPAIAIRAISNTYIISTESARGTWNLSRLSAMGLMADMRIKATKTRDNISCIWIKNHKKIRKKIVKSIVLWDISILDGMFLAIGH